MRGDGVMRGTIIFGVFFNRYIVYTLFIVKIQSKK